MDIASTIGAAAIVTQQTSQQVNTRQDHANVTGVATGGNQSVQQRIINETQNAASTANAANNGENAASNDDAGGSDHDKDNAASKSLSGVGAHINITA